MKDSIKWTGKRHFTIINPETYSIMNEVVTVEKGLLGRTSEPTPLHRFASAGLHRGFFQRIFGVCTITLHKREEGGEDVELKNILYTNGGHLYRRITEAIGRYDNMMMFSKSYRYVYDESRAYSGRDAV